LSGGARPVIRPPWPLEGGPEPTHHRHQPHAGPHGRRAPAAPGVPSGDENPMPRPDRPRRRHAPRPSARRADCGTSSNVGVRRSSLLAEYPRAGRHLQQGSGQGRSSDQGWPNALPARGGGPLPPLRRRLWRVALGQRAAREWPDPRGQRRAGDHRGPGAAEEAPRLRAGDRRHAVRA